MTYDIWQGFTPIEELATARCIVRGNLEELQFSIHGKAIKAHTHVALRASGSKRGTSMYSIFLLPTGADADAEQATLAAKAAEAAGASKEGGEGVEGVGLGVGVGVGVGGVGAVGTVEAADVAAVRYASFDSVCKQVCNMYTHTIIDTMYIHIQ
jgi:hypothetical protein